MTWFGIVLVVYWLLNMGVAFYIIGAGGIETTPGGAVVSLIVFSLLLWGLFAVGTGYGI